MKAKLNLICCIVADMEKHKKFWMDLFDLKPPKTGPYSKVTVVDEPLNKNNYMMLQLSDEGESDYHFELVEPKEGPLLRTLKEQGEGLIYLLSFKVDDIEAAYDELKQKGLTPVDWFGSPLVDKKYCVVPTGSKFFFLTPEQTHGTFIEFCQRAFGNVSPSTYVADVPPPANVSKRNRQ